MTPNNRRQGTDGQDFEVDEGFASPAVILVEPQLGENIGTAARAMLNFGLTDLRLVRPRTGWKNDKTFAAASGAKRVLTEARLFESTEAAIANLHNVYASTGRPRDMVQRTISPSTAGRAMRMDALSGSSSGVLFGPERSGLTNDDLSLADVLITVPANPAFRSLNLAMAVLLIGYEWFVQPDQNSDLSALTMSGTRSANKSELQGFFDHLEGALDDCGFLRVQEMRPHMVRNIRNIFQRAQLTEQEVRTLRGIISGLVSHASSIR